jgi:hypothetical protein
VARRDARTVVADLDRHAVVVVDRGEIQVIQVIRPPNIANAWVYSDKLVPDPGRALSAAALQRACTPHINADRGGQTLADIPRSRWTDIAAHYHQIITLQPVSRYWLFQAYETTIFAALALLLAAACFWWVGRRLT